MFGKLIEPIFSPIQRLLIGNVKYYEPCFWLIEVVMNYGFEPLLSRWIPELQFKGLPLMLNLFWLEIHAQCYFLWIIWPVDVPIEECRLTHTRITDYDRFYGSDVNTLKIVHYIINQVS